jgi:hypothetical protein
VSQPRRSFKLLVLLASFVAAVLIAEAVLRVVRPLDTANSHEFRVPHPTLGWVLQAGVSYRNRMPGATSFVTYNSAGFRDVEHAAPKVDGRPRMVVLGDSFMEGYSVELEESFHRRLEQRLNESALPVETINLGVGGYGTLQQLLLYREVARRYAPQLVLLGVYLDNDVRNNSAELESKLGRRGVKTESRPFLEPGEPGSWSLTDVDYDGALRRYNEGRKRREDLWHRLAARSALLHQILSGLRGLSRSIAGQRSPSAASGTDGATGERERRELASNGVHYCEEPPVYTRAWELTERILLRLNQEVQEDGARLVVFTVPAHREVNRSALRRAVAETQTGGGLCLEEAIAYDRLAELLARLEIELVDLLEGFRSVAAEDEAPLFRRGDRHWNPHGHALAAELVTDALLERGLAPRGADVGPNSDRPAP